ncbi:MAG: hypothetical protein EOO41_03595, partial [Methanobacteriota archaeon]
MAARMGVIATPAYLQKAAQLYATLNVRFGVALVGVAGSGKTAAYVALSEALTLAAAATTAPMGSPQDAGAGITRAVSVHVLNPKALSLDAMYGVSNPVTAEWRDGLVSRLLRDASRTEATVRVRAVTPSPTACAPGGVAFERVPDALHVGASRTRANAAGAVLRGAEEEVCGEGYDSEEDDVSVQSVSDDDDHLLALPKAGGANGVLLNSTRAVPNVAFRVGAASTANSRRTSDAAAHGADSGSATWSIPADTWLVFDGPIDSIWIESMNSVLDDTRTLTLASNERVKLPSTLRLLFEVGNLAAASPATVSRLGVVHFAEQVVQWRTVFEAWLSRPDVAPMFSDKVRQRLLLLLSLVEASLAFVTGTRNAAPSAASTMFASGVGAVRLDTSVPLTLVPVTAVHLISNFCSLLHQLLLREARPGVAVRPTPAAPAAAPATARGAPVGGAPGKAAAASPMPSARMLPRGASSVVQGSAGASGVMSGKTEWPALITMT